MQSKKVLALDFGQKLGWAHSLGMSGTFDMKVKRDESPGIRLLKLRRRLNEFRDAAGVDVLVFEAVRNAALTGRGAVVALSEYQGVTKEWCEENAIDYKGYSPTEIKSHATGNGKASKADMIEATNKRWGKELTPKDDNEADALCLLDYAMCDLEMGE